LRSRIQKWKRNHELTREALLRSLEPAELVKVDAEDSAFTIWNRLEEEYGQVLDSEYVHALCEFHGLKKDDKTSMDDHIAHFSKLLKDVEYNKPPDTPVKRKGEVNLIFMASLGEDWKTFLQAKGTAIHTMSTSKLYAEVRAANSHKPNAQTNPSQPPDAKALSIQFDGNRNENQGGRGREGNFRGRGGHKVRGRGRSGISKRYSRP